MGSNILERRMIEETLATFGDGAATDVSPAQGVMLLDGWLQALDHDPNVDAVKLDLRTLREYINGTGAQALEPGVIRDLLNNLASQAEGFAQAPNAEGEWTGQLKRMAQILRNFGNRL